MTTPSSKMIVGRYNAREFGLKGGGQGNDRACINRAILQANIDGGGVVVIPADAGTVLINGPILLRSNVELVLERGVTVRLIANQDVSLIENVNSAVAISNVRISGDGIFDGNRGNQDVIDVLVPLGLAGAARHCGYIENATDLVIEGLTFQSASQDGLLLVNCTRPELRGVRATDNGRHGIHLSRCTGGRLVAPASWDNCKVEATGTADGIHLSDQSTDNAIIAPRCYDTAAADDKDQGYGVREETGSACNRNIVAGGALNGNKTGATVFVGAASQYLDIVVATTGTPADVAATASIGSGTTAAPVDHVHTIGAGIVTAAMIANRSRKRWIGAAAMSAIAGAPTATIVGTAPVPIWSLPDGSTTGVGGTIIVPEDWVSGDVTINVWWSNEGAGSGNVVLNWTKQAIGTSELISASNSGTLAATAAPAEDTTQVTELTTLTVAAGEVIAIGAGRTGGDAGDTLGNAIGIIGIELVYTADS